MKPLYLWSLLIVSGIAVIILIRFLLVRQYRQKQLQKKLQQIGSDSEQRVAARLNRMFGYHKVLTNLYLPNKNGATTELDIVFISRRGIFVLECKHYSGKVFGDEEDKLWIHRLPNGDHFEFYNPIAQNRAHYHAIRRVLNQYDEQVFHPILVFSGPCKIRKIHLRTNFCPVIKERKLLRTLKKISRNQTRLSMREVDEAAKILSGYTRVTKREKRQHLKYVRSKRP